MIQLLHKAEEALKPLLDSIGEGVLVVDPSGKPLVWNAAAEHILGVGALSREIAAWTDRPGVYAADGETELAGPDRPLPRAIRGETVDGQNFVVRTSDGRSVLVSATARALRDATQTVTGGIAIFRDISKQGRAEKALLESEQGYRTLARHLPSSVVLMYNRSLLFTLAEGGGLAAAGFTPGQIEGRPVEEFATPALLKHYRAVFDGVSSDVEVVRNEGRLYRVQLAPVRDEKGYVFAGLMLAADITEQRRRETERSGADHFKFLAEAIPQIVWTSEPNGEIDYYNEQWFTYTGMTLEQTKGWGWGPVLHPDDLDNCVLVWSESVRTGNDYEVQYRFKRAADGQYRWHLGRARPVRNADGDIIKWFGTCTDIDDQRKAVEALREAQEGLAARVIERTVQLSALNETLGESLKEKEVLLKEVHHRVKNNLQVISSLLKLHAEQVSDPTALAAFQDSQDRVRAIALLHEQLYQSKNLGAVSVSTYAEALVTTLVRASARRAVRFSVEGRGILLPVDSAVPFGLILNELVANSLKHAFNGPEIETAIVRVDVQTAGPDLELVVVDNGAGFPVDFTPATVSSLGMHLIRALTRQLGGAIQFTNRGGAECRLLFPKPSDGGLQ